MNGSVDGEEFDVENEGGAAGYAGLGAAAVSLFGRDVEFPAVAHVHLLECYDPSRYEVAKTECGSYAAAAAVKCLAVDGLACVMGSDDA